MFDRNTSKIGSLVLVSLMMMAAVFAGGVAAEETEFPVEGDLEVNDNTESVYVDVVGVEDFDGADPVDVEVTLTGMNSTDDTYNDTEITTETLTVDEGMTESVDYSLTDSDRSDYEEIAVSVEVVTGDESLIETVDWGALEDVGTGGAGGDLGSVGGIPVIGILGVLVVGYFVMGRD